MAPMEMEKLIGKMLNMTMNDETTKPFTIVDVVKNHGDPTKKDPSNTKFRALTKEKFEKTLTHDELMGHRNDKEKGSIHWDLCTIVSHQKTFNKNHPK